MLASPSLITQLGSTQFGLIFTLLLLDSIR